MGKSDVEREDKITQNSLGLKWVKRYALEKISFYSGILLLWFLTCPYYDFDRAKTYGQKWIKKVYWWSKKKAGKFFPPFLFIACPVQ